MLKNRLTNYFSLCLPKNKKINLKTLTISAGLGFIFFCSNPAYCQPTFIAVGQDKTVDKLPLLIMNNDNSWEIKNIPAMPYESRFTSASCTGSGKTAICIVAGVTEERATTTPPLAVSNDAGNS